MDENKNTIIIAVCALCLFMTLIIACSRGCSSKPEKKVIKTKTEKLFTTPEIEKPKPKEEHTSSRSSYSFSSSSSYPPAILNEKDKERLEKKYKENKKILGKLKKEWFEKELKDPNISPVAREQYMLRSNPDFVLGMRAYDNEDYETAIKSFNKIIKDKNTSPVSKYFACKSLMDVAIKTKDPELYFIAARMRGNLEANEDLSILGLEKSNFTLDWCDKVENSIKASVDSKYFDICVKLKLANCPPDKLNEETLEKAKKDVEKDIKYYTKEFKELIE